MADAASPVVLKEQAAPTGRAWRGRRVLIISAILALAAFVFVLRVARTMPDFEVYWHASTRAAAGEPLYREADGQYQSSTARLCRARIPVSLARSCWRRRMVFVVARCVGLLLRLSLPILPNNGSLVGAGRDHGDSARKFYGHDSCSGR